MQIYRKANAKRVYFGRQFNLNLQRLNFTLELKEVDQANDNQFPLKSYAEFAWNVPKVKHNSKSRSINWTISVTELKEACLPPASQRLPLQQYVFWFIEWWFNVFYFLFLVVVLVRKRNEIIRHENTTEKASTTQKCDSRTKQRNYEGRKS